MARSTAGVIRELNIVEPINVVQAGSVWAKATSPKMKEKFEEVVTSLTGKKCNFIIMNEPPVMGAILWAYEIANGKLANSEVKNNVLNSIIEYQKQY